MNYSTPLAIVYVVYAVACVGLTWWLARTLFRTGAVFLEDVFADNPRGYAAGRLAAALARRIAVGAVPRVAALVDLRHESSVPRRLSELAILVTARAWNSQYAWRSHEKHAKLAGLEMPIIDAIRHRRRPDFVHDTDIIVYELAAELNEARAISDATTADCAS